MNTVSNPLHRRGIVTRAILALALIISTVTTSITATIPLAPPAGAVENTVTTARVTTTVNERSDKLTKGGQIGSVHTKHWADTTLTYPKRVRAGQTFQYTRCVVRQNFEEVGGYEVSIDNSVVNGVEHRFSQVYTQGYSYVNRNDCVTFNATAPSAGSTSMSIPSMAVGQWGGVGYAGSCCPTWNLYWGFTTTDNTLAFEGVYTKPLARNDGPYVLLPGGTQTVAPLANDDGFTGGLGAKRGTPVSMTITQQATRGTCSWSGTSIVYVSNGTAGTDSCKYSVNQGETDGQAPDNGPTSATVSFMVNRPPTPVDDSATTDELTPVDVHVLANDSDPDGNTISLTSVGAPDNGGSASVVAGKVRFDPGEDFVHLAPGASDRTTVDYAVTDQHGVSSTGHLTVTITGLYTSPVAVADVVHVDEDGPSTTFDPRVNDIRDDGAVLSVRGITTASFVGVASYARGSITVDPDARWEHLAEGETGTTSLTYDVSDTVDPGTMSTGTVVVTVHGSNDGPTAASDRADVDEKSFVVIDAAANDTDPDDSDVLHAEDAWIDSGDGSVSITGGKVRFDTGSDFDDLAAGETQQVQLGYTVADGHGGSDSSTILVTVYGVNDDPTAQANSLVVGEDGPSNSVEVIAGDHPASDPDTSDVLTVASVTQPHRGSSSHGTTTVSFDPAGDFEDLAEGQSATTVFSYTITDSNGGSASASIDVTIEGRNDAPVAMPDVLDLDEDDGPGQIDVLANDFDVDDGSSFTLVSIGAGSFAEFDAQPDINGSIVVFDPGGRFESLSEGEVAEMLVLYRIEDEHGATSSGVLRIRIHGVNDAPIGSAVIISTDEDTILTFDDLASHATDVDRADVLSVVALDDSWTTASAVLEGGTVTFDPRVAFNHLDDDESDHDGFAVTISDGHGGTTTVTVLITVTGVNDAPAVVDDEARTDEDTPVTVDVLANDSDSESNQITLVSVDRDGVSGRVRIVEGGVHFDPTRAFNHLAQGDEGVDVIRYTIRDEHGATSRGTLVIRVDGINDAPDAGSMTVRVGEHDSVGVDFSENPTGVFDADDGAIIHASGLVRAAEVGTTDLDGDLATYSPAGMFEYLAEGQSATQSFDVSLVDEHDAEGTATVDVVIEGVNDAPTANPDETSVADWRTPRIDLLANDTDPDLSDTLSLVSVSGPGVGTLSIEGDRVRWDVGDAFTTLRPGVELKRTFTYVISDGHGGTSTSTAVIHLTRTMTNDQDSDGNGIPDWFEKDWAMERDALSNSTSTGTGVTGPWNFPNGIGGSTARPILPGDPSTCPTPNGYLHSTSTAVRAGMTLEVVGSHSWLPYSRVSFYVCSTPILLGRVDAGVDGLGRVTLRLPRDMEPGEHMVVGVGMAPDGTALVQTLSLRVYPADGNGSRLAFTGGGLTLVMPALGMVVVGSVVVHGRRRNRRTA